MNRSEKLKEMNTYEIVEAIIQISASSTWKCRLCAFKDNCNKDCFTGILNFLMVDEKGSENK